MIKIIIAILFFTTIYFLTIHTDQTIKMIDSLNVTPESHSMRKKIIDRIKTTSSIIFVLLTVMVIFFITFDLLRTFGVF